MILVFGGTTEGKRVMQVLEGMRVPYVYSTKTKIEVADSEYMTYRYGVLDKESLYVYAKQKGVRLIIDAAHPFAIVLHDTLVEVSKQLNVPVVRFARKQIERIEHDLVKYVSSYSEMIQLLETSFTNQRLLSFTGVQTIKGLKPWWVKQKSFFRILDRDSSRAIANESKFPVEQLVFGLPSDEVSKEISLIKSIGSNVLATKESGDSGFLSTKIKAALETKNTIIILKQPTNPEWFEVVYTTKDLEKIVHLKLRNV